MLVNPTPEQVAISQALSEIPNVVVKWKPANRQSVDHFRVEIPGYRTAVNVIFGDESSILVCASKESLKNIPDCIVLKKKDHTPALIKAKVLCWMKRYEKTNALHLTGPRQATVKQVMDWVYYAKPLPKGVTF